MTSPRPQLRWDDPRLDERVETPYTASSRRAPKTPTRAPEAAIRALDLTVRKRIDGLLAGDHRTSLPGLGTELHQLRAYEPGDDVRQIEWNVTARTGEPHVQVQLAERSLTTWLVLDISPSMNFGTAMMRKLDAAEGVALAIGHLATRRGNRLGVVTFGGPDVQILPPRQGRSGLLGVLNTLEQGPPADGPGSTTLTDALQRAAGLTRGTGLVAVVADFRGTQDWEAPLGRIAQRHAVIAVEVADPREESLPDIGEVEFVDPESGRALRVNTADRQLRERFAEKSLRGPPGDARRFPAPRRRACPVHHRGPLAPPARRLPPAAGGAEMSFQSPLWLLLLLFVPAAIFLYASAQGRRSKYAVRFTNLDLLGTVVAESPRWRRHVPFALMLVALTLLLAAVARPEKDTKIPRDQATVILVMDISGSMNAEDVQPTRLAAAQEAASAFLKDIPAGFRVGIVSFAQYASVALPPTHDRQLADDALARLRAEGGTAMGDAINLALDTAQDPSKFGGEATPTPTPTDGQAQADIPPTVLLLLSDGFNTAGTADPLQAAQRANQLGVKIFTVALGTPSGYVDITDPTGSLQRVQVPPDEATLQQVANTTDAQFFSALSGDQLTKVYEGLSSQIGYDTEKREITWWFAGFAALFLVASAGVSLAWFNRFP